MVGYKFYKIMAQALQALGVPIGVASGVMLAFNQLIWFVMGIVILMALNLIQSEMWYRSMERLPNKGEVKP